MSETLTLIYERALDMLGDGHHPERWCRGIAAENETTGRVPWNSPRATAVCLVCALQRSQANSSSVYRPSPAVDFMAQKLQVPSLQVWNDIPGRTYQEVIEALRATLAAARVKNL